MTEPLNSEQIVEEVHLKDYIRIILRRRKIFVLAFLATVVGVAAYTFTMKPIYEASSTLHVRDDKGKGKGSLADELGLSSQNPVDTEIEILKSATNAEQVVTLLHLDWNITDRSKGILFTLQEFDAPEGSAQPYNVTLVAPGKYIVADSTGAQVAEGRDNVPFSKGPFRLLLTGLKGNSGDSFKISKTPIDIATSALQGQIKAVEVGKKTSIIKLTVTNTNPVRAREITNTSPTRAPPAW